MKETIAPVAQATPVQECLPVRVQEALGELVSWRLCESSAVLLERPQAPTLDAASGESAAAKRLRIEPAHAMSRAMRVRFAPTAAPTIVVMRAKSPVVA